MMNPLLARLLGMAQSEGQGSAPQPQQAPPTLTEVPEEFSVAGEAMPKSRYKQGIIQKGFFSPGQTGGNILGAIGDAFLTQARLPAQYAPRLQQLRSAEALENFTTDPMRAIQQFSQVDPMKAAEMWQEQQQLDRQGLLNTSRIRAADEDYEGAVHTRAGSLIGAATKNTWDPLRKRYYQYYASKGVQPLVELPETFDDAVLESLALTGVDPEAQAKLQSQAEYRKMLAEQRAAAEAGRNTRAAQSEAGRNARFEEYQDRTDTRLTKQEEGRDRRSTRGRARPNIKIVKTKDGRVVVQ